MHDLDLEWLLCVVPGLTGAASGHEALVAALERGQGLTGSAADSERAEARVERARPYLGRARRLEAVWRQLSADQRRVLVAHYTVAPSRAPGVVAQLGRLSGVCMLLGSRSELEQACLNPTDVRHATKIRRELSRAERLVKAAHRAWKTAKAEIMAEWLHA